MKRVVVSRHRYFDSVFLMQVAQRMTAQPGMHDAYALLATDANKKLLAELGYADAELAAAGPGDLAIALEGESAAVAALAGNPDAWLQRETRAGAGRAPRSIREAVATRPDASLALISVPGRHAAREARAALEQGLDVFLFSSNVPRADELALKQLARDRGLIVMGPDCGTAYVGGAGLGFANAVRRGPVGLVASAGTGMQEFASLVHRAGSGISHGIGVGSHDLSDEIGGLSTFAALDALEADRQTRVIAILAKPVGPEMQARLVARCARSAKPVVLCLLGARPLPARAGTVQFAKLIDDAVQLALAATESPAPVAARNGVEAFGARTAEAVAAMRPEQRHVRGLFAGGTLCYQAQVVFRDAGLALNSNVPIPGMSALADPRRSVGDTFVDLGTDDFVEGRPHPMIDATLRRKRLQEEGADPAVALVLLDFVLGANASPDPAGDLLPAIRAAMAAARQRGGALCVVTSVCGTEGDAQGLAEQTRALGDAGVHVFPSAAQAAAFARDVARRLAARGKEH